MPLHAPGGTYFGTAVNAVGYFETPPCKDKRCREPGPHTHTFDVASGHQVTTLLPDETHGMRGDARDVPARKAS